MFLISHTRIRNGVAAIVVALALLLAAHPAVARATLPVQGGSGTPGTVVFTISDGTNTASLLVGLTESVGSFN